MKKKILVLFCACSLCLGLLVFPASLAAGDTPCFLAINDNLQLLEDRTIPIAIDGQYYVPYTALDYNVTQGVSLGIFPVYNAIDNTLMIYNFDKTLVFDLTYGTCKDRNGVSLNARAVNRNGRIYVPARFICEQFGLTYSSRTTIYGPLVRLRNASSRIDDANFVGLAQQMLMESRLREWRKSQTETSSVTPTPPLTPTPAVTPVPEGPGGDKSGVYTYLAFRADQTDGLEELLAVLEQYQVQALFFFPAAELADYDDAVRRVLCGGHAVGLLVSGAAADAAGQADEGNRILARIAYLHTNTLLADGAEDETVEELEAEGWLCWSTDVDALPDGRSAYRQASAVLGSVDLYHNKVCILSDASAAGAALLERLLPSLFESRYNLRLAVETEL